MEPTIFMIHGLLRYVVLLVGVAAAVAALVAWRRTATEPGGADRGAMAAFVGLLDLQVLLGVILLLLRGFYGALMGHIVMMIAAAAVGHVGSARAKRATTGPAAARIRLIATIAALLLMIAGITAIGRPIL